MAKDKPRVRLVGEDEPPPPPPPPPPSGFPPFAILSLTPEQIRLLALWPQVPIVRGAPDVRAWARMAAMPLQRATILVRGLTELGVLLPQGRLHPHVEGYLTRIAKDRLS